MIKKDVNARFDAEQALNHDWIQKNSLHSQTNIMSNGSDEMKDTVDKLKLKQAILAYLTDMCAEGNLQRLSDLFAAADPQEKGICDKDVFFSCIQ